MHDIIILFFLTFAAGLAIVLGAMIASVEHIHNRWLQHELHHAVISFGGGLLVSAVALVLVPEGIKNLHPALVIASFGSGGLFFMGLDIWLSKIRQEASQFAAMLLDFIPEILALGALFLLNKSDAFLLTLLIILQNIPEGFNAYRELHAHKRHKKSTILLSFLVIAFLGPITGLTGYFFLSGYPFIISEVMLFGSGGILYLIFQDIAPQAKLKHHWAPSLGAVAGFLCGIIGKMAVD
jgi:zinc transporter, ZIP family